MKELKQEELKNINGGFSFGTFVGIGAIVTFIIGVIDGYVRPLACR